MVVVVCVVCVDNDDDNDDVFEIIILSIRFLNFMFIFLRVFEIIFSVFVVNVMVGVIDRVRGGFFEIFVFVVFLKKVVNSLFFVGKKCIIVGDGKLYVR